METLFEAVKFLGLPVVLTIFFVWQGWLRECRLSTRIDSLEDFQNTKLLALATSTATALENSTEALKETARACNDLREAIQSQTSELRIRPCMVRTQS